jgi:hypothetical protein
MVENGVLLPILANYAQEFTAKIEGFDLDSRIFPKVLVDNESTIIRNAIAVQMGKKLKKAQVQKNVLKMVGEEVFN